MTQSAKNAMTQQPDMAAMTNAAEEVAAVLRALSNPDRLLLLCQLTLGEKSVSELEEMVSLRQPSLSQQLGVLRTEGLVTTRRDGKRIFYSVDDPKVLRILTTLHELYCAN
ncbi:ArsR/SmtB family transcription factor [Sapientia aquatica]|nr:metalloregulator ArsR/SmtB family transcription factor [Sapientia aquatica]